MSFFNQTEIEKIISFALAAGEIAIQFQKSRNFVITVKPDGSKVTTADITISKFLAEKLNSTFPNIAIVCEEGDLRQFSDEIFWLIDPIDGTSSFIEGSNEFAINIALIKNKKPIFGLIYAPLFEGGKLVFSNAENKILLIENILQEEKKSLIKNISLQIDSPYSTKQLQLPLAIPKNIKIVTSKRTKEQELKNYIAQNHPQFLQNFTTQKISSAVKFFPLLENKAQLYISFRNMMEWDTAAGQALVELIGGKLKNLTMQNSSYVIGDNLHYKKPHFQNQFFIGYLLELNT